MSNVEPFIADGISLGIPNTNASGITELDNAIFLDENGFMHFRDEFVRTLTDVDGNPKITVTLKEMLERMQGVFTLDGKLYFKDSSTTKPISLDEIAGSYKNYKSKLTNGGIYWIGRTQITSSECDNIIIDVEGDPTLPVNTLNGRYFVKVGGSYPNTSKGTKVFSLDKHIIDLDAQGAFSDGSFKLTGSDEWRWHDVPNLKIIIPSPLDTTKIHILSKVSVRLIKNQTPVVFRLIDETTGIELDRTSLFNDSEFSLEQQGVLSYVGDIIPFNEELRQLSCECFTPEQMEAMESEPPHTIKVQFYVDDILEDIVQTKSYAAAIVDSECTLEETLTTKYVGLERRLIGLPNTLSESSEANSTIDVILYNTDPTDNVGRKVGTVQMNNTDIQQIIFDKPFNDSNYSVSFSSNKNINMWYTNKKSTGFTIRAEKKMIGTIDWTALKLSEGN